VIFDGEEFRRVAVHAEPSFAACSHRHCEQDPTSIRRSDEGLSNMLHDGELRCVAERLSNQLIDLSSDAERCGSPCSEVVRLFLGFEIHFTVALVRQYGRTGANMYALVRNHYRVSVALVRQRSLFYCRTGATLLYMYAI
jgi:hypothetical protein